MAYNGELDALEKELLRQHVMMHGDGKGQTTTVPFLRSYSQTPGDLDDGSFILVGKKGTARPGRQPNNAKVMRSPVYHSRLTALRNMDSFRQSLVRGRATPAPTPTPPALPPARDRRQSARLTREEQPTDESIVKVMDMIVHAIEASALPGILTSSGNSPVAVARRDAIANVGLQSFLQIAM